MRLLHSLRGGRGAVRMALVGVLAAALLLPGSVLAASPSPIVYNARKDFQLAPDQANPSGPWSYRQTYANGSRRLLTHFDPSLSDVEGVEAWTDEEAYLAWPWVPSVWYNNTGADYLYTPADRLFVHPGNDHAVVIRWTSPGAGRISIQLELIDRDNGGGDGVAWSLGRVSHPVLRGKIENGGSAQGYIAQMIVQAGTRIDLKVSARADQGWDTTQVGLKITYWPN